MVQFVYYGRRLVDTTMHKFQITTINEKVTVEVLKGNTVLFTKDFELTMSLDEIKEQLRKDLAFLEVKEKEKERLENKKNEFRQLLNKKIDLDG